MTRNKKLFLNLISSLMLQLITLICGFILPQMFLSHYGSAVNGLVSSIVQFLEFISLAECGVGAVVQSALYKPLAEKNDLEISKIFISSERFFKRVSYILIGYVLALVVVYPLITLDSFDYVYTSLLILAISISTFAQYYYGMTYRLLLSADQLGFIQYTVNGAVLIINTVSCIVLMHYNASIHTVKLATSLIFLLQPIVLSLSVKKRYKIDRHVVLTEEPIKQKWNGLAQHIAAVILVNTDTVVLTLFSTLENVSVYAVYNLVVNGLKQIIFSLTNGMQAMFGNMLAKKEMHELDRAFDNFEWLLHTVITVVFTITAVLIVPFVSIYTKDINDADYIIPLFAYVITLAQAVYCTRLPYNIIILAAGHYKQTQLSAIIESVINILVSVILVVRFGLIGVAVGTLVAMVYKVCYVAFYLSKNILYRKIYHFLKQILADILNAALTILVVKSFLPFYTLTELNYISWLLLAVKTGITVILIGGIVNMLFYREKIFMILQKAISIARKK